MDIDQQEFLKPDFIIDILSKWRWAIIGPLLAALAVGSFLAIKLPKIYEAETLILIQPQRVPTDFVQSIVTTEISDRINTLSQQILSRSNLERIIAKFRLFSPPDASSMFMEDKVNALRERISVETRRSRQGTNSFTIRVKGKNPKTVTDITNDLANSFIDENIKIREAQALGTSDFLDAELTAMREKLEAKEEAVRNFRISNMGELPEQLETNLRALDRLQERLNEARVGLRDARAQIATLQNQTATNALTLSDQANNAATFGNDVDSLKMELSRMQSRYTDKHPDIIKLKNRINELEQEQATSPSDGGSSRPVRYVPPAMRAVQNEIRNYESDIQNILSQISQYERRVESTPRREQELLALQRDYTNLQGAYQNLLNRRLEAEISVNMERKQKGEQFRILDRAQQPERPVEPNMQMIFLITVAAGFGIGGAIIFLFELMKKVFRFPKEIETQLGVPTLAMIPLIEDRRRKVLRWVNSGATVVSLGVTMVAFAFFTGLTLMGVEPTFEIISKLKTTL